MKHTTLLSSALFVSSFLFLVHHVHTAPPSQALIGLYTPAAEPYNTYTAWRTAWAQNATWVDGCDDSGASGPGAGVCGAALNPPATGTTSMGVSSYDTFTGLYAYSAISLGSKLIIADTVANSSMNVSLPCSTCNRIAALVSYNGTVYGIAGDYHSLYPSNYSQDIFIFAVDLNSGEIKDSFMYTIPSPYKMMTDGVVVGVSVIGDSTTLYTLLYELRSDNVTYGHFTYVDLPKHEVQIQIAFARLGCTKIIYDYSDGTIWCPSSNGISHVNISDKSNTSVLSQYWISDAPGFYLSQNWVCNFDIQNKLYYTLAGNSESLYWVTYDYNSQQVTTVNGSHIEQVLWNIDLTGTPLPCYGCVHGTCDQTSNKCTCLSGYSGIRCTANTTVIIPDHKKDIHDISKTNVLLAFLAPIVTAILLKISGIAKVHFSFRTLIMHLQMLMIPIQVNQAIYTKIENLFKYMGLFTLTPPFTLDLKNSREVFLNYGNYLFPKVAAVILAIIILAFVSRAGSKTKGVRLFGIDILFKRGLVYRVMLLTFIPLIFSLCAVALNIQSADYGYVFSTCYVLWNTLVLGGASYLFYTLWFQKRAHAYYSFGATPTTTVTAKCQRSPKSTAPKFAVFFSDADKSEVKEGEKKFFLFHVETIPSPNGDKEIFMDHYDPIFSGYHSVHLNKEDSPSIRERLRSKLCHQFEFIRIVYSFLFIVITVLLWRTWIGLLANVIEQALFMMVVMYLKPFKTFQSMLTAMISNAFLLAEFVLLVMFNHYVKWGYLLAVAILALVDIIVCVILVPILFATVFNETEKKGEEIRGGGEQRGTEEEEGGRDQSGSAHAAINTTNERTPLIAYTTL